MKMRRVIEFCLVLYPLIVHGYTAGSINLLVRSSDGSNSQRYCIELAQLPNGKTIDVSTFAWRKPVLASSSINACNVSNLIQAFPQNLSSNTMLILYEHQCTITEQSWNVEQSFGSQISLMIITDRTNTQYELTYNVTTMPVSIPVVVFWSNDFAKLTTKYSDLNSVEFSIANPPDMSSTFRPAILLMFLLVFIVLICGNLWAADEFKKRLKKDDEDTSTSPSPVSSSPSTPPRKGYERRLSQIMIRRNSIAPTEKPEKVEPAVMPMTYCVIVVIICAAVGWLLLLFYFPTVMIYILQVMFCIGAFTSLTTCLGRLSYFVPILRRYRTPSRQIRKPCAFKLGPLNLFTVFAMCISLTLVVIWYVYRQREWAWILQNILGAAVCMTVLSIYRVGNMRVITIILVAFLIYDIFFVFITPFIPIFQRSTQSNVTSSSSSSSSSTGSSSSNPSVMEQVALGMGTNGEVVPLSFALPLFIPESETNPCLPERRSILGFGDVILPGMLLNFCKIFDIASPGRWPIYYIQSVISYFVGLAVTHIALFFMRRAQPALLYIVPCLLISTIVMGLCRRELKELYSGKRIEALFEDTNASNSDVGDPTRRRTNDRHSASDVNISVIEPPHTPNNH